MQEKDIVKATKRLNIVVKENSEDEESKNVTGEEKEGEDGENFFG